MLPLKTEKVISSCPICRKKKQQLLASRKLQLKAHSQQGEVRGHDLNGRCCGSTTLQQFLSLTCSVTTSDLGQQNFNVTCSKFQANPLVLAPDQGLSLWPMRKEVYLHCFGVSLSHPMWHMFPHYVGKAPDSSAFGQLLAAFSSFQILDRVSRSYKFVQERNQGALWGKK